MRNQILRRVPFRRRYSGHYRKLGNKVLTAWVLERVAGDKNKYFFLFVTPCAQVFYRCALPIFPATAYHVTTSSTIFCCSVLERRR